MSPTQAQELFLSTDYPQDKVLETFTGNFSAGARYGSFSPRRTSELLLHSVGDWALVNGAYSLNGSTWYPLGVNIADTSGAIPTFQTVEVNAYCTVTNLVVQASNWTTSARTVYYAIQLLSRD